VLAIQMPSAGFAPSTVLSSVSDWMFEPARTNVAVESHVTAVFLFRPRPKARTKHGRYWNGHAWFVTESLCSCNPAVL